MDYNRNSPPPATDLSITAPPVLTVKLLNDENGDQFVVYWCDNCRKHHMHGHTPQMMSRKVCHFLPELGGKNCELVIDGEITRDEIRRFENQHKPAPITQTPDSEFNKALKFVHDTFNPQWVTLFNPYANNKVSESMESPVYLGFQQLSGYPEYDFGCCNVWIFYYVTEDELPHLLLVESQHLQAALLAMASPIFWQSIFGSDWADDNAERVGLYAILEAGRMSKDRNFMNPDIPFKGEIPKFVSDDCPLKGVFFDDQYEA